MNYLHVLNELYTNTAFRGRRKSLDGMKKLMMLLKNPQDEFESIHVTGTNGKGSVCKIISELLISHGFHVGLFVSPHLSTFRERISVDGKKIGKEEVVKLMKIIQSAVEKMKYEYTVFPLTFFDLITAMAFLYFKEMKVDVAVLEVGVGGRLDSTNIVENVKVGVITSVGLDHTETLGNTIEKITFEKTGIVKRGMDLVCSETKTEVIPIVSRKVEETRSKLFIYSKDYDFCDTRLKLNQNEFNYIGMKRIENISLNLNGYNQILNASTALFAFERFMKHRKAKIKDSVIKNTLEKIEWHGRFEVFRIGEKIIVLDGAHNPSAVRMLVKNLDLYFPRKRKTGVIGIIDNKDRKTMLSILKEALNDVIITNPIEFRTHELDELVNIAKMYFQNTECVKDRIAAFKKAMKMKNEVIVVTGSLYLVGYLREYVLSLGRSK